MTKYREPEYAAAYLAKQDTIPQRGVGERLLIDLLPSQTGRVLDLGCGDGRLFALVRSHFLLASGVLLDHSPAMLDAARQRDWGADEPQFVAHDLTQPLPDMGQFDAVVSGFAIHHLPDERKRELYSELRGLLFPGGVLLNLEHVASSSEGEHGRFLALLGGQEDASNRLSPAWEQVQWLVQSGFNRADVVWKWLELALIVGWTEMN